MTRHELLPRSRPYLVLTPILGLVCFLCYLAFHGIAPTPAMPEPSGTGMAQGGPVPRVSRPAPTRSAIVAFTGDFRPTCETGAYNVGAILGVLGSIRAKAPDMVMFSGDYLCAWPHEPEKALAQLRTFRGLLTRGLGPEWPAFTHFAYGNHEVGHESLIRASLGDAPMDTYTVQGALGVISFPSDFMTSPRGAPMDWLRSVLSGPLPPLVVFVRHEPWNGHGVRRSQEVRSVIGEAIARNDLCPAPLIAVLVAEDEQVWLAQGGAHLDDGQAYGYVLVQVVAGSRNVQVRAIHAETEQVHDQFTIHLD